MACFHPIQAFQTASGQVVFVDNLRRLDVIRSLQLACGQCWGCRLERSRQWAVRCMHEAQLYPQNSFNTLTYDEHHVPPGQDLIYRDFQLFMKRLRKNNPHKKIRFYMAGEYGEQRGRPHFHACLFNHDFNNDKQHYKKSPSGAPLYTSPTLTKLWPKGLATTGALTFETAAYTARYIMKKITGPNTSASYEKLDPATGEITNRKKEFNNMSRRPGIAKNWLRLYNQDITDGKIIINGKQANAPRYYINYLAPSEQEQIHYNRHQEAHLRADDNTDERLAVREQVAIAKTRQLKRTLT